MARSSAAGPIAALLWIAAAGFVGPAAAAPLILPFEEVRAGMRGHGRTVFHGTAIEEFAVEVLGTLPNVGPDEDLILVRLTGGPLERTGVMAGMSGSPVFLEGRLAGAVAYSWGFAKEAIAGVTPIEQMLEATGSGSAAPGERRAWAWPAADWRAALDSTAALEEFIGQLRSALGPAAGRQTLPIALAVAGLGAQGVVALERELGGAGFVALQAGGAGVDRTGSPAPLEPGSAVGVKLVRGDLDVTATGTATWVEDGVVLAFGHPLFGLGAVDLPLTGARVEALLPSFAQSARIATPLAIVGAVRQDRSAGIAGRVGAEPRMIPVRVELAGANGEHRFAFDIADDPLLSPLLLYVSLQGIVAGKERAFGSATVRLGEGSVIQLLDQGDVTLDNLFAGPHAFDHGTGVAAYVLHLLMNNTWTRPAVVGINLLLECDELPRTARIRRVGLDRYRVAAGERVEATIALSPYRGPDAVVRREFVVPAETEPGKLTLAVGGALAVTREIDQDDPLLPRDLEQLVWLINQLRRNDRIYLVARRPDTGILLGGARLPNLPPSAAAVLTLPAGQGSFARIPERSILEEVVTTDYAIEGSAEIRLEVVAP